MKEVGTRSCNDSSSLQIVLRGAGLSARSSDFPAICIASIGWSGLFSRPQHLMSRYSRKAPVLYVDPIQPPHRRVLLGYPGGPKRKVLDQLWSLSIVKPLPLDRTFRWAKDVNDSMVRSRILSIAGDLGLEEYLLWFSHYDSLGLDRTERNRFKIYDCIDDWSEFKQAYQGRLPEMETRLIRDCNVVFTSSVRLFEEKRRLNPHTFLVPNGVDVKHFSSSSGPPHPIVLQDERHPIVGFSGTVSWWVDLELVEAVARKRPDWTFVFVGPIQEGIRLPRLPNLRLVGAVAYEVLPAYLGAFDVCLIPFRKTKLVESVDPIKVYEYMAMGKVIVSTPMAQVERFRPLVEVAEGPVDFERAIERALRDDSSDRRDWRRRIASENSWDHRFQQIMKVIHERRDEVGI